MAMNRILIVEDDRDIAELVQYNLKADGLDVTLVSDGSPALCELQKGGYDLLVLDLMLPKVSGLEVCKAVRCDPTLEHTPILVMTARGEDSMRALAFAMGASDYLAKPFSPRELITRVRALLHCAEPPQPAAAGSSNAR
jgi:two-component system, OmpR family, phosphate regulon response regulator PhoB